MKKYNKSTKCYKIDIFVKGNYTCSTDCSKTCIEAKKRFFEAHMGKIPLCNISCKYYRS